MAVHTFPVGSVEDSREGVVKLPARLGARHEPQRPPAPPADVPAIVALQLEAVDSFVEMIRLRGELADRDLRIAGLAEGLRLWRERAMAEEAQRHEGAREAHGREREIISLLHQQMQMADAATAELERVRSLSWWRRLRG